MSVPFDGMSCLRGRKLGVVLFVSGVEGEDDVHDDAEWDEGDVSDDIDRGESS